MLRVLEVGALKPDNYASCTSWMDVTPIDLHSRHPSILEQDFLAMDEAANTAKWDLISLSLVVNFVPDVEDRGALCNLLSVSWSTWLSICLNRANAAISLDDATH